MSDELTSRVRQLLLELCEELLPEEDIIALAGRGGSKKGRVTRVATQAGVKTYGVPIGTVITEAMKENAKSGGITPAVVSPQGGLPKPNVPSIPGVPKLPAVAAPKPKGAGQNVASQFNADPNLKMQGVHTHPGAPGARVYQFSDGTAVFEDAKGTRSKRQKVDLKVLKSKGWNVQEVKNAEAGNQVGNSQSSTHARLSTDKPSNHESSSRTLETLAINKSEYTSSHRKAVNKFESDGAQINDVLRKGDNLGEHFDAVSDLRDLLDHSKASEPVTVYRGMNFANPQERDDFVANALRPDTSFIDKGFTVASANSDNALLHADNGNPDNPGAILNIAVSKGSRAASLNAVTGKDDQDHDVLLADGAKFKVNSVSNDSSGRPIAQLTYLDPAKPAHERAADEDNIAITPEQKEAARASRFSWKPGDIELDHLPFETGAAAPVPPKPAKAVKAAKATTPTKAAPAKAAPVVVPKSP